MQTKRINMQELSKFFAVAFTIIAIATESAMIVSGLMYGLHGRVIVAVLASVMIVPMVWGMWGDVRKNHA